MESGLEGRNNDHLDYMATLDPTVSMESGLEGRNNPKNFLNAFCRKVVSMESGLEGRNNSHIQIGVRKDMALSQWSPA